MILQEDINLMYNENDWGVYKYNVKSKSLINELLNFSNSHSINDVRLSFWPQEEQHEHDDNVFDLNNMTVYLYYRERSTNIYNEILNNDILENKWYDSDCYTLDKMFEEKIRKDTPVTKRLLKRILRLNTEFNKLVYPIKTEK